MWCPLFFLLIDAVFVSFFSPFFFSLSFLLRLLIIIILVCFAAVVVDCRGCLVVFVVCGALLFVIVLFVVYLGACGFVVVSSGYFVYVPVC